MPRDGEITQLFRDCTPGDGGGSETEGACQSCNLSLRKKDQLIIYMNAMNTSFSDLFKGFEEHKGD